MPLPLILGIAAAIAAAGGVGAGIHGGVKLKEANDTMKVAEAIQKNAIKRLEEKNGSTTELMDSLGTQELNILSGFEQFSNLLEKIQGRPEFKEIHKDGVNIPHYDPNELKEVSVGAGVLIGGLGGAAAGTAGGFAAAGAATSAVMALGTASTGTAIASLSGAAATNATLAALGGGAIAAGGGGIALGTTILGVTTLGVGLLVGGIIFNVTGSKLSDKADDAYNQACETKSEVDSICEYLNKLEKYAKYYENTLTTVNGKYKQYLSKLENMVNVHKHINWNDYTDNEKLTVENTVLLVGMLYKMCKVQLVLKSQNNNGLNKVNVKEILDVQSEAKILLDNVA